MMVYVSGAVNHSGVVQLNSGARVMDAVKACGGLLPSADADKVNMAQALKDGAQIAVPEKTAAPAVTLPQAEGRISINTADEKALDSLRELARPWPSGLLNIGSSRVRLRSLRIKKKSAA